MLGQLQDEHGAAALAAALADTTCHAMVRHEAAIALGSIAGKFLRSLTEFVNQVKIKR